jgi:hypothetical protein
MALESVGWRLGDHKKVFEPSYTQVHQAIHRPVQRAVKSGDMAIYFGSLAASPTCCPAPTGNKAPQHGSGVSKHTKLRRDTFIIRSFSCHHYFRLATTRESDPGLFEWPRAGDKDLSWIGPVGLLTAAKRSEQSFGEASQVRRHERRFHQAANQVFRQQLP